MTLKELEQAAASAEPMADQLNAAEQLAYLSMRLLYVQHALRKLDTEQARIEKTRIIKEFEINQLRLKCWETAIERERKLSFLTPELKNSGCELCRKYFRILSGLKE